LAGPATATPDDHATVLTDEDDEQLVAGRSK